MSAGEAPPAAAPETGQGQPAEDPRGRAIGAPPRVQAPQRARAGDFAPHVPNTSVEVLEAPENPADPWSGLVDRSLSAKGNELARAEPKTIQAEADVVRRQSEQDANVQPEPEADPYDAQAEVMDPDEAQEEYEQRYASWKKSHDAWEAFSKADDLGDEHTNKFRQVTLPNGRKTRVAISELERGYLRQNLLTQRLEEVYAFQAQLERTQRGMNAVQAALSGGNPGQFLDMITYLRAFDTFHAAALMYGEQLDKERNMDPEKRQMLHALRAAEADKQRALIEANSLRQAVQQQQQVQQVPADVSYYEHQLAQMLPRAAEQMAAEGTPWVVSDLSNEIFARHMKVFARSFDGELSTEKLKETMIGVMQEVGDWLQAGYVPAPQPTAAKQLPPSPARTSPQPNGTARSAQLAGAPNYSNGGRQPKRARLSDINTIHRTTRQ